MKHLLYTIIGAAALTMPAAAQNRQIDLPEAMSPANGVQIPEGAFEIALPNLTIAPVSTVERARREVVDPSGRQYAVIPQARKSGVHFMRERSRQRRLPRVTRPATKPVSETALQAIPRRPMAHALLKPSTLRMAPALSEIVPDVQVTEIIVTDLDVSMTNHDDEGPNPTLASTATDRSASFSLTSAMPNPAVEAATISFKLERAALATLTVFDQSGRVVATLADELLDAGIHSRRLDVSTLPAGLYLYRLSSGGSVETRTVTVVR